MFHPEIGSGYKTLHGKHLAKITNIFVSLLEHLNSAIFQKILDWESLNFSLNLNLVLTSFNLLFVDLETKQYSSEAGCDFISAYLVLQLHKIMLQHLNIIFVSSFTGVSHRQYQT